MTWAEEFKSIFRKHVRNFGEIKSCRTHGTLVDAFFRKKTGVSSFSFFYMELRKLGLNDKHTRKVLEWLESKLILEKSGDVLVVNPDGSTKFTDRGNGCVSGLAPPKPPSKKEKK